MQHCPSGITLDPHPSSCRWWVQKMAPHHHFVLFESPDSSREWVGPGNRLEQTHLLCTFLHDHSLSDLSLQICSQTGRITLPLRFSRLYQPAHSPQQGHYWKEASSTGFSFCDRVRTILGKNLRVELLVRLQKETTEVAKVPYHPI